MSTQVLRECGRWRRSTCRKSKRGANFAAGVAGRAGIGHARCMTRVDLKGERPDDATETRTMGEQARRHEHVDVSNRTFLILLVVIVTIFGGLALYVRL
jgi:hypothetical protein